MHPHVCRSCAASAFLRYINPWAFQNQSPHSSADGGSSAEISEGARSDSGSELGSAGSDTDAVQHMSSSTRGDREQGRNVGQVGVGRQPRSRRRASPPAVQSRSEEHPASEPELHPHRASEPQQVLYPPPSAAQPLPLHSHIALPLPGMLTPSSPPHTALSLSPWVNSDSITDQSHTAQGSQSSWSSSVPFVGGPYREYRRQQQQQQQQHRGSHSTAGPVAEGLEPPSEQQLLELPQQQQQQQQGMDRTLCVAGPVAEKRGDKESGEEPELQTRRYDLL